MPPLDDLPGAPEEQALELFNEFVLRLERGEPADFEALCREHPTVESGLRRWCRDWHGGMESMGKLEPPRLSTARPEHFNETRVIEETTRRLVERIDGFRRYGEQMVLACGGMGTIYRVQDNDLRRQLAMKVLRTEPSERVAANRVARFLEEAQVTAQLDHPGIVPVHELGIDPHGSFYFTMKLVRGRELGTIFELARTERDDWSL